jgi:hypothetical protein
VEFVLLGLRFALLVGQPDNGGVVDGLLGNHGLAELLLLKREVLLLIDVLLKFREYFNEFVDDNGLVVGECLLV